jgi:PEP-CTERM motif
VRNKPLSSPWAGAGLLGLMLAATSWADTAVLNASADATLFEVNPNNSAGGDVFFLAGTTQNRTRTRALLQFDIASALPAGSQINAVGLQVEVTRRPSDGFEASLFGLHRVLRSWGEGTTIVDDNAGGLGAPAMPGDATWLHRFAFSDLWGAPGGAAGIDYKSEFSSSLFIFDLDLYEFEGTPDMIADVQYWLDNPTNNFGWMLRTQSEEVPFTGRRFASREDPNGGGPRLIIDYTVVPEPGTVALCGLGLLCLAGRHWRRKTQA